MQESDTFKSSNQYLATSPRDRSPVMKVSDHNNSRLNADLVLNHHTSHDVIHTMHSPISANSGKASSKHHNAYKLETPIPNSILRDSPSLKVFKVPVIESSRISHEYLKSKKKN